MLIFQLDDVAVNLTGWTVRFFMVLRENYLGSFTHFSTLYEYLDKRARGLPLGDPVDVKYRPGTVSNHFLAQILTVPADLFYL